MDQELSGRSRPTGVLDPAAEAAAWERHEREQARQWAQIPPLDRLEWVEAAINWVVELGLMPRALEQRERDRQRPPG